MSVLAVGDAGNNSAIITVALISLVGVLFTGGVTAFTQFYLRKHVGKSNGSGSLNAVADHLLTASVRAKAAQEGIAADLKTTQLRLEGVARVFERHVLDDQINFGELHKGQARLSDELTRVSAAIIRGQKGP